MIFSRQIAMFVFILRNECENMSNWKTLNFPTNRKIKNFEVLFANNYKTKFEYS